MKTSRLWRLSARRTSLLSLPVVVAFIVGGSAPIIFGGSFNVFSGALWAFFIGVVDYNMLVLDIKGNFMAYIFRFILLGVSILTTAIVGDLTAFDKDIKHILAENNRVELDVRIGKFRTERATLLAKKQEHIQTRNCQDPSQPKCAGVTKGKGDVYNAAVKDIKRIEALLDNMKKPTIADVVSESGILVRIQTLHGYVLTNKAALILSIIIGVFIMLLEITPIVLKNSQLK